MKRSLRSQDILSQVSMFWNNLEMFLNNFFHLNISALRQNSKNPPHNLFYILNLNSRPTKFKLSIYERLKLFIFGPFQVVQKHALSERLKLVCAAQICGEVLLEIYFRAEILRCKNQVVQKHLQGVPKHGNMGQNILVRLHYQPTEVKNNWRISIMYSR